ncbi:GDYXXLXY domain-containing protein [bacterium]|nr:GDYXXLXY domain-containing protein [bacterium]
MKLSRWLLLVFGVVALGQLAVPAWMIARRETTLRHGRAYKFRTRPVDPYDAFRGRYVALGFEQNQAAWGGAGQPRPGKTAYAVLAEDEAGWATVREVTASPPGTGAYLKIAVNHAGWGTNAGTVNFRLPFDRYYLEETKAPRAERLYLEHNRRGQTNLSTYAVVRVRAGDAVLEDLVIGGRPVADWLAEQAPPDTR